MHTSSKITIVLLCFAFFGLNSFSKELSCNVDINCDRFDYTSVDSFNQSVIDYAEKWNLNNPNYILYKVNKVSITVNSINDGLALIKESPELIYSMGKYIEVSGKPKEWQYVFEQSFIRSFNNLKR